MTEKAQSLEEVVRSADSIVDMLRGLPVGAANFPVVRDEYTHWIEEQRAWRETVALSDQSYHMTGYHIEGPEALSVFTDLGISNYDNFEPGKAKQFMPCNPDGYTIGDGILFYLDEEELVVIGLTATINWVQYNFETGDYYAVGERQGSALELGKNENPAYFRYEVQGPDALDVIQDVTEEPLPEISFFNFDTITIGDQEVNALRHSMSGEAGFELWGPYEHGEAIKKTIMDAGEKYGIRHLGTKSYRSGAPMTGWVEFQVPAVYESAEMADYREWLSAKSVEARCSIGGSYYSSDITDYYLSPVDLGHEDRIDFSRDFVGKESLAEKVENPERTKVSFFWDGEDLVEVFASLFTEGDTYKFMELIEAGWSLAHYDAVLKDGETIGVSTWPAYNYNERMVISIGCIDIEYSDPGTDVTLLWGEENSPKPHVERHVEKEVRASVGPIPPGKDGRLD